MPTKLLCALPENDAWRTMAQIFTEMPHGMSRRMETQIEPFWCVKIADEDAAFYARMRYHEVPFDLSDPDAESPLEPGEIIVPQAERPEVERMLREESRSAATWQRIVSLTAPEEVCRAFQVAHEQVVARKAALDELERLVDEELAAVGALLDHLDLRGQS
jgi:hypothetical protein